MRYIINKIFALYNIYCRIRLYSEVPGVQGILEHYMEKTGSTGTKFTTLYHAVRLIKLRHPTILLECGTGASTVVLAETLKQLKARDASYAPRLVSMESIDEWHGMASDLLPKEYSSFVDILLGEREKYEYSCFRGYCHSNIPILDYDFVFLDGPSYKDPRGASACMDAIKVRLASNAATIGVVVDTRVSSVFVMQNICGSRRIKYRSWKRTCTFHLSPLLKSPELSSESFISHLSGRLSLKSSIYLKGEK